MINFSHLKLFSKTLTEGFSLIPQAKSGESAAFVKLYDVYVERVYRYIHFLAPNNKVAEGIALQVFFKAWEYLEHFQILNSSFVEWLYSIAQDQIAAYYRTHKKAVEPDDDFTLAVRGGDFSEEFQTIRDGLHFLTTEQQQVLVLKFIARMPNKNIGRLITRSTGDVGVLLLNSVQALAEYLQGTELSIELKGFQRAFEEYLAKLSGGASILDECWVRYPEYADQLVPLLETALLLYLGRDVKPMAAFNSYTHDALIQYTHFHPRRTRNVVMPALQRTTMSLAMLAAFFLVTGTAQAQSALPGDVFYAWKRTSEQAWRAMSPDPVAADIVLAERRLSEWIAVSKDSARSTSARGNYLEALNRLKSTNDVENLTQIVPALQSQEQILTEAGLESTELSSYLVEVVDDLPVQPTPTKVVSTSTQTLTKAVPTSTKTMTKVVPTSTETPTEVVPTPTRTPTEIVPTPTKTPTEVVPTPTETPTEVVPTPTKTPTEVVPTPTETPTEVVPTPTKTPTEVVPTPTETPTEVVPTPTRTPTEVVPTSTRTPTEVVPTPTETPTESVPTETAVLTEVVLSEAEEETPVPPESVPPVELVSPTEVAPAEQDP
jgi:RNA polymerase sigma factor (sigma-70 family)